MASFSHMFPSFITSFIYSQRNVPYLFPSFPRFFLSISATQRFFPSFSHHFLHHFPEKLPICRFCSPATQTAWSFSGVQDLVKSHSLRGARHGVGLDHFWIFRVTGYEMENGDNEQMGRYVSDYMFGKLNPEMWMLEDYKWLCHTILLWKVDIKVDMNVDMQVLCLGHKSIYFLGYFCTMCGPHWRDVNVAWNHPIFHYVFVCLPRTLVIVVINQLSDLGGPTL